MLATECGDSPALADARRIRDSVLADRLAQGEQLVGAVASPGRAGEPRVAWITDGMLLSPGLPALADSHYAYGPTTAADEIADNCGTAKVLVAPLHGAAAGR